MNYYNQIKTTLIKNEENKKIKHAQSKKQINESQNINKNNTIPIKSKNNIIKQTKGNIPINKELLNKYPNVEEIFVGEKDNFAGEVKIENNISELQNIDFKSIKPIDSPKFKEIAISIFKKYNSKNTFLNDNNKIEVSNGGIRKSIDTIFKSEKQLNMLKEHLIVFSDIGDIIEHAMLVNQALETKNRENIKLWNYYFDGLNIDGNLYNLEFDVRSMANGKNQYRVQRLEPKKVDYSTGVANKKVRNLPAFEQSTSDNNGTTNLQKSQIVPS